MRYPFLIVFLAIILASIFTAATAETLNANTSVGSQLKEGQDNIYYHVRPDFRRCIAPLCGGYWVSEVNRKMTRCADGSRQQECYVAKIRWQAIGVSGLGKITLILGKQHRKTFPGFGNLGVVIPEDAWRPASENHPEGKFFSLRDSSQRCVTFPCFNITQRVLNRKRVQKISGLDLSRVGAEVSDEKAAYHLLTSDELIAVGKNVEIHDEGPAGDGVIAVATQFYLPVQREPDRGLACETVKDCTLTEYHSFVGSPAECYCLLCPTVVNAETALKNQRSWQQHCNKFGLSKAASQDYLMCPQIACIEPRPWACINKQCVFLESPIGIPAIP